MTDPRETLARIKEQADKARQARADYDAYRTEYLAPVLIEELKSKDDVPRLVGALQAVLDLHQPRTEHVITGDCSMEQCEHEEAKDCPKTPFEVCVRCYAIAEEVDSYFMEDHIDISAYPCAEYRAITDQLGDDR